MVCARWGIEEIPKPTQERREIMSKKKKKKKKLNGKGKVLKFKPLSRRILKPFKHLEWNVRFSKYKEFPELIKTYTIQPNCVAQIAYYDKDIKEYINVGVSMTNSTKTIVLEQKWLREIKECSCCPDLLYYFGMSDRNKKMFRKNKKTMFMAVEAKELKVHVYEKKHYDEEFEKGTIKRKRFKVGKTAFDMNGKQVILDIPFTYTSLQFQGRDF